MPKLGKSFHTGQGSRLLTSTSAALSPPHDLNLLGFSLTGQSEMSRMLMSKRFDLRPLLGGVCFVPGRRQFSMHRSQLAMGTGCRRSWGGGWFSRRGRSFCLAFSLYPWIMENQVCLSTGPKRVCSPYKRAKTQGEKDWLTKAKAFGQQLPYDFGSSFFRFLPLLFHVSPFSSRLRVPAGTLRAVRARPPPRSGKRELLYLRDDWM